jgi:hypothetical protein
MGRRGMHSVLVGKPKGKIPLAIRRRMWEDNIKMDVYEMEWGGMNRTDLAQARARWKALVIMVMNLRVL